MSSLNKTNISSTKYCQKINKIRLSEVFFCLNALCFKCGALFVFLKSDIILHYFINVDSVLIDNKLLIAFQSNN